MAPPTPPPRSLLLCCAEPGQQRFLSALSARGGWRCIIAADTDEALRRLKDRGPEPAAALIDDLMRSAVTADGFIGDCRPTAADTARALRAARANLPIVVIDTPPDGDAIPLGPGPVALAALGAGADDIVARPLTADRLILALDRLVDPPARAELRPFSTKFGAALTLDQLVGAAPLFRNALKLAERAARGRVPVLIEGPPGSGKATLARAIHAASPRAMGPLRSIDCAAVAPGLTSSGLFGHEQGAFPGAFDRHVGQLMLADGGTLIIEDIECLPLDTQGRLVEWLHSGVVAPLGSAHRQVVDVRVIASAASALLPAIQAGRFREDLYYALSAVQLTLPALDERRSDTAALAGHFLTRAAGGLPGLAVSLAPSAADLLAAWHWPGNIRQLQDVVLRAALRGQGPMLDAEAFPALAAALDAEPSSGIASPARPALVAVGEPGTGPSVALYSPDGHLRPLEAIETDIIRLAITHYRGRMSEVARRLGIGRSTLYRKLSELGIDNAA